MAPSYRAHPRLYHSVAPVRAHDRFTFKADLGTSTRVTRNRRS